MPYTVEYAPAPLNFIVRPGLDLKALLGLAPACVFLYIAWERATHSHQFFNIWFILVAILISGSTILAFIRNERIEIHPDRMVWRKTYFGIPRVRTVPLAEVLGAEWTEGQRHEESKGPDFVEFFLPSGSVRACYGFTFEEFDSMREHIRTMYPDLVKRWAASSVRSKDFTLLNLN